MLPKLFSRNGKRGKLTPDETKAMAESDPNSFGNLAVELGFITQDELRDALAVLNERIGEVLVRCNKITTKQRDALMLEQRHRRGEKLKLVELQRLERSKFQRGVSALTEGFKEAATDARGLAASVSALTIKG